MLILLFISLRLVASLPADLTVFESDSTIAGCPDQGSWTLNENKCYYPATDYAESFDDAEKHCDNMDAELAMVKVGETTVFDLAQFGAIHPGDRFWVETDPATNLAVTDRNGDPFPPFNCSFVGFTLNGDTEFGTAPCDTTGMGYLCFTDVSLINFTANPLDDDTTTMPPASDPSTSDTGTDDQQLNKRDTMDTPSAMDPNANPNSTVTDSPNPVLADPSVTPDSSLLGMNSTASVMADVVMRRKRSDDVVALGSTAAGGAMISPALPTLNVNGTCPEPWFVSPTGDSCYLIAPTFSSGNYFESSAFCQNLDGWLVEPDSPEEFAAVNDTVNNRDDWTNGPWIGLLRPFNDTNIVLLSSLTNPDSVDYQFQLKGQLHPENSNTSGMDCVGFSDTGLLGLWNCMAVGNPFCEKDLLYTFVVVNASAPGNNPVVL